MAAVSPRPLLTSPDALPSGIVNPLLDSALEEIRAQYLNNKPFRFVCVDEFLSREAAHRAASDLASALSSRGPGRPAAADRPAREAPLPAAAEVHQLVCSAGFARLMSRLTDEKDLLPNGDLFDTSSVERFDGAFAVPHHDTGTESRRTVAGRVRLLIFLSPEWKGGWGGAFEIYDDPRNPPVCVLEPVFNRAIIHEVSDRVWIGRSRVSVPPLGEPGGRPGDRTASLKEIAACFGGLASEAEARSAGGATIVEPVPKRFVAGYTLTEEDTSQLKRAVGQRDSLIRAFRSRQARTLPGEDLGPGGDFLAVLRYLTGLRASERRRAKADQLAALRHAGQAAAASRTFAGPQLARALRPLPALAPGEAAALLAPVREAGLFDAAWYCARHPDAGEPSAAWDHFVRTGLAENRDPHPLFDTLWYRAQLVVESKLPPILHFLLEGGRQGLSPHPLFDAAWYLATNPDLAATRPNPLVHFLNDGAREGRSPHPAFLNDWYKKSRGAEALAGRNPLVDYIVTPQAAAASPHPLFDGEWYLKENPDVAARGEPPLVHYLRAGYAEGRDPHPLFDTSWYLDQNPDVAVSGVHPFVHFLQSDPEECRRASPWFDPKWYLERNYDVRNARVNPLVHYVTDGAREGRLPNPSFPLRALREAYGNAASPMLVRLLEDDRLPQPDELRPEADRAAPASANRLPDLLQEYVSERFGEAAVSRIREILAVRARYAGDPDAFWGSADARRLAARLAGLAVDPDPNLPLDASIILPSEGNVVDALAALLSIFSSPSRYRFEVILGDVAEPARPGAVVPLAGGRIRYSGQQRERGFLAACRAIGREARGRYLVLFPADAIALPGWLDELIGSCARDPRIGCVAGKRLRPDGTLQAAPWRDSCLIAHAGDALDPRLPRFNYVREAGLSLAASVAMPGEIWNRLGEFGRPDAAPGREDVELASRIEALGLKTVYEPFAELVGHRELDAQDGAAVAAVGAPAPASDAPHVLVVDHRVPRPDRDAGSRAVDGYLKLFLSHGLRVSLWSDAEEDDPLYSKRLQQMGIEVAQYRSFGGGLADWLQENARSLRYILLSRPHVAINYIDKVRNNESKARIIYLSHDVTWLLLSAEHAITHAEAARINMEKMRAIEEKIWQSVDVALFFNAQEGDLARRQAPGTRIEEIPLYLFAPAEIAAARQRLRRRPRGGRFELLFVGGFDHPPNRDAVEWFVREIFGRLRERDSRYHLTVAGSNPPAEIRALAGPAIAVAADVSEEALALLYRNASAAVVPLRYGAGMKGKVIEAFAHAVPVVTTTIGIQGIAEGETLAFVADNPESFVAQIVAACTNDRLATSKALKALDFIEMKQSVSAARRALAPVIEELQRPVTAGKEAALPAPAAAEMRSGARAAPAPQAKLPAPRPGLWRRLRAALGFEAAPQPAAVSQTTVENAMLRDALAEQQEVIGDAAAQLEDAAKRLEEARAELAGGEAALAEQTERVRELTSRAVEAEGVLAKRDAAVASRDAELAARDAELDLMKSGLAERDAALARVETELAQRDARLGDAVGTLEAREREAGRLTADLAARDSELDLLKSGLVERDAALARLETEVDATRAAVARVEAARGQLEAELAERNARLCNATQALAEQEREGGRMKIELATRDAELDLLKSGLVERDAALARVEAELAERDARLGDAAATLEAREREASRLTAELAAGEAEHEEMRSALAQAAAARARLEAEAADRDAQARATIEAAREEVADSERALAEAARTLEEREQAVASLQAETAALRSELAPLRDQVAEESAAHAAALSRLAALRDELAGRNAALVEEAERADATAARLAAVQSDLAEREAALAEVTGRAQQMAARVARAEIALAERERALAELTQREQEAAERLAQAEGERAESEAALAEATGQVQQMAERVAQVEAALAESETALAEVSERAQVMAGRVARAETERAERAAALGEAMEQYQELAERAAQAEAALAESERAFAEATDQAQLMAGRVARAETELAEREQALAVAENDLVSLQGELASSRSALLLRDAALARAETEAAEQRSAVSAAQARYEELLDQLAGREAALAEATERAQELADRAARAESELADQAAQSDAALAAAAERAQELVDRLGLTENSLAAAGERARQMSERARLQEAALAERDAALARLEGAVDSRDRAVETARAELIALQAELAQRRLELARSEEESAASHQAAALAAKELAALREELAAREEALFEASSEAAGATTRLAAVAAEHEAANAALAAARQKAAEHAAAAAIAEAEIASLRAVLAEQASALALLRRQVEEQSAEAAHRGPASARGNVAAMPADAGSTLPAAEQASGAPATPLPRQERADEPVGFVDGPKR